MELLTTSNILFSISIISVIFAVYLYFKNPQTKLEKDQALNEERDKSKANRSEIELLAEKQKWECENNDKKFNDLSARITDSMALAQNHIHTVDTKVDELIKTVGLMSNEITKLSTIIDERIPKGVK